MDSVNPLNILKLLQSDYEQHFQLSDSPSEFDRMLKTIIKVKIDLAGSPISAIEEDLAYELPVGMLTFDELEESMAETNLLHGHSEADFESIPNDRLTKPATGGTEPSSDELYYNTCDRKITKFVAEKCLKAEPDRRKRAEDCVAMVREGILAYGEDCLWNADQSGFEYEMSTKVRRRKVSQGRAG
ncbi:hypothetical protein RvY_11486 [Ramazzottius varieornatus]|uniref:Uncharacterized protein n=1 Tax=Ramazzottius varieornatus TaxID=947166 RepID=A0A1D1VLN8_RAMVA|nr:hypothetical protein RvY_11486 [Ramazzottius varieornatus]